MYYKRHYRVNQKNNKRRDKHRRDNAKNCHAKSVNSKNMFTTEIKAILKIL